MTKRKIRASSHPKKTKLIGVIHLPALPGSPLCKTDVFQALRKAKDVAVQQAQVFAAEGFDGLVLENFGDVPFFKSKVPPLTVSAMTAIAEEVRELTHMMIGVNVLRNDSCAALAIAIAAQCDFIRVNVLSGVVASDQGIIEGCAAELMRHRASLKGAERIAIWGDLLVKHSETLSTRDPVLAFEELTGRGGADAVIVTGASTGRAADVARLEELSVARRESSTPIYLGSGATAENAETFSRLVDGAIVGSSIRQGGRAGEKLDLARVRKLVKAWKR